MSLPAIPYSLQLNDYIKIVVRLDTAGAFSYLLMKKV
jgi:hypothetical protein